MAVLISNSHEKCFFAFQDLLDALQRPARDLGDQVRANDVQEEFGKYKIWAGNVGAAHSGKRYEISLDYRLREASFLAHQVLKLLKTLIDKLENASSLVRGGRKPFEEYVERSEEPILSPSSSEADEEEEDAQSSPWDISSSSGESNDTYGETQFAVGSNSTPCRIAKLGQLPAQELPRLLASIKFVISCLYRIPIRKPAPFDRFKDDARLEWSCFQHFDVLYVSDKFPHLDCDVATRLGQMITRWRQLLFYRQTHKKSLHTARVEPASTSKLLETEAIIISGKVQSGSQVATSQTASSHFTSHSKATTFQPGLYPLRSTQEKLDPMGLYTPSIAESKTSVASSFAENELRIQIPPRPTDDNGVELNLFECPYCLISKQLLSENKWKWVPPSNRIYVAIPMLMSPQEACLGRSSTLCLHVQGLRPWRPFLQQQTRVG